MVASLVFGTTFAQGLKEMIVPRKQDSDFINCGFIRDDKIRTYVGKQGFFDKGCRWSMMCRYGSCEFFIFFFGKRDGITDTLMLFPVSLICFPILGTGSGNFFCSALVQNAALF